MDDAMVLRVARGAAKDYAHGRPDALDELLKVLLEEPEPIHSRPEGDDR